MTGNDYKLDKEQLAVSDDVADEILQRDEKHNKFYFLFLMLLLIFLTFIVSSLSFALFGTYVKNFNNISTGSVLFSYEENSNNISISDMYPTSDAVGKKLSDVGQYFDFSISSKLEANSIGKITYEISLVPDLENTLDSKYVRINLLENGKDVLFNNKDVVSYNELSDSKIRSGAKVLFVNTVKTDYVANYVFRMWVSSDFTVTSDP